MSMALCIAWICVLSLINFAGWLPCMLGRRIASTTMIETMAAMTSSSVNPRK
jgi:hypothetical protein